MSQKLSAKQRAERLEKEQRRQEAEENRRKARETRKRIFTIVVCVILVLALGIPTVAIMAMGGM
ncbi:MAG: CASC3 protein CASC3 [Eggerthellales bacterium]|nr:CASC3 protein CASC3 [Eggerthellales bacterium]